MGDIFPYIYIYIYILHCLHFNIGIFFELFFVRLQGTTNEAFVVDAIWLVLEHCQLFTHHHATKVIKAIAKYCTNMGIVSNSLSKED
jgi:hypothetical protein